jgi:hypothetical protein
MLIARAIPPWRDWLENQRDNGRVPIADVDDSSSMFVTVRGSFLFGVCPDSAVGLPRPLSGVIISRRLGAAQQAPGVPGGVST